MGFHVISQMTGLNDLECSFQPKDSVISLAGAHTEAIAGQRFSKCGLETSGNPQDTFRDSTRLNLFS